MGLMRSCLDCGVPTRASRCPSCAANMLQRINAKPKANTTDRGYGSQWQKVRRIVLDRDQWTCYKCQKKLAGLDATVDHIIPLAVDKTLALDMANLAACCRSCNSSKRDKTK